MESKRSSSNVWPEREVLVTAQRSLARYLSGQLHDHEWRLPTEKQKHLLGNYVLLSAVIVPDEIKKGTPLYADEKQAFIEGLVEAGLPVRLAEDHAQNTYATRLPKNVFGLDHIPKGAAEITETTRNGRPSCWLNADRLCRDAIVLGAQAHR